MKNIKKIIYVSAGGVLFISSMVQNRNLPIIKRIKVSSKNSLRSILLGLGLQFGKFNGETIVEKCFKTVTVSTTPSTRDCTQCLSIERSNSKFSDDELKALGFPTTKDTSKEVTLVVGISTPHSSKQKLSVNQEPLDGLVHESHIPMNAEQKPKILMSKIKSDLKDPRWVKEFILSIKHGGAQDPNEKLIRSILSKISDSDWDIPSINKILQRIGDITVEIGANSKLMRILGEFERPFPRSIFDGMEIISPQDILRFPGAESFPTPSLPPSRRRPQTRLLAVQKNDDRYIVAQDGVTGLLTDKSTNHLLAKHGNSLGIDDPLPPNPNQKTKKHKQIRTRINKKNKQQFEGILEKILQNPTTEVFPDVSIRGSRGQVYVTEDYGGFLIGIHTEGEFAGQIMKAQPISDPQLEMLRKFNKID